MMIGKTAISIIKTGAAMIDILKQGPEAYYLWHKHQNGRNFTREDAYAEHARLYQENCANEPQTEVLGSAMHLIPYEGLEAIGRIFAEGLKKYGRDNWKKGQNDTAYQEERLEHAIRHLMLWANGDRTESHLAKVAWFCVTQLYFEAKNGGNT